MINNALFATPGDTCEEAVDYGLINGDTVVTGNFNSDDLVEDYWIQFTTSCNFRDITISTCGSLADNSDDELHYIDTIIEVYSNIENDGCEQYEEYDITLGQAPTTDWWNDDPDDGSNLMCDTDDQDFDGEEYHAVLLIPTAQEQAWGIDVDPGTYFVRVSAYPGAHQTGDWQLSITGRATMAAQASDLFLELPHNPLDGSPGGSMTVELDGNECICVEQIGLYEWIEGGNIISGPSSDILQYVLLDEGLHDLILKVTDLAGNEYQDDFTLSITEPNIGPTADAGEDQAITIPHDGNTDTDVVTVTLLGENSSDDPSENDEITFVWEKLAGPNDMDLSNNQGINPTFNTFNPFGSNPKEYQFQLTVTDPYGASDSDTTNITIFSEQNANPVASSPDLQINIYHDGDPYTFNSEEFTLNGTNSEDPDGDNIVSYEWFDSQLNPLSEIAFYSSTINYSTIDSVLGDHGFILIVTDPYGAVGETSITLTIEPELNDPPTIIFDPPIAEFIMNPDDSPGGSQIVVLDVYSSSSFDPEGDLFVSEWFDMEGNPVESLQSLPPGQSSFLLRLTDSYEDSSEAVFNVLIFEPNIVPTAVTYENEEYWESTADVDAFEGVIDTLFLYGWAVDGDHTEYDLGASWALNTEEPSITMLNTSSFTGSFLSGEILHNDYPLNLDFSLTVWDPFSCYIYNTQAFEDLNNNGQWDEDEDWDSFCLDGESDSTYDVSNLNVKILNYNTAPEIFEGSYVLEPINVNEDEETLISFDYNLLTENNFFFDVDDCSFNPETNECVGYYRYKCDPDTTQSNDDLYFNDEEECDSECLIAECLEDEGFFTVEILEGENYTSNGSFLIPTSNYFGSLSVPVQINDNNYDEDSYEGINNLSEIITLEVEVQPVNDIPVIISFDNSELISEGVLEDTNFTINLNQLTYYDVEGDGDNDGICDPGECLEIELFAEESENYSFVGEDIIILTENFFGTLELGIQIFDGEDFSEVFYVDIPVHGVNDYPSLIEGMDTVYFLEDFDTLYYDLGNIFTDVDGDQLFYEKIDQDGDLLFTSEIIDEELLMISEPDVYGEQEIYFDVSDGIVSINNQTVVFSIEAVDDSPIVSDSEFSTSENTPVTLILEAFDIDSDSVEFEILEDYGPNHGTIGQIVENPDNPFLASIIYTPQTGYRCADFIVYKANDFNSDSDTTATITINVGACNYPPNLMVDFSPNINIEEDTSIYFVVDDENLGWCADDNGNWQQLGADDCSLDCSIHGNETSCGSDSQCLWHDNNCIASSFTENLPINHYDLSDSENFLINDEWDFDLDIDGDGICELEDGDQCEYFIDENENGFWDFTLDVNSNGVCELEDGDECEEFENINFIEIWESDYYYIENGYCASSNSSDDWYIDTEIECGLINSNETCESAPAIDVGYGNGIVYCPCDVGETCTASQKFISDTSMQNSLSIKPVKDYDLPFNILMVANDDNLTYNISSEQNVSVIINPINDPPSIGSIENQMINEGETLELSYSWTNSDGESDFTIYDVDSDLLEISQSSSPDVLYRIVEDCPDNTLCLRTVNENWNGNTVVYITVEDDNLLYASSDFVLAINPVDDGPSFTDITIEGSDDNLISLLEDTPPITYVDDTPIPFARQVRIYYTDNDWCNGNALGDCDDPDLAESEFYANDINLTLESSSEDPHISFSLLSTPEPTIEDDQFYYSQVITLNEISEDWNGSDVIYFNINDSQQTLALNIQVNPQNDAPNTINQIGDDIPSYNQNSYDWSGELSSFCEDENGAQGIHNLDLNECIISNFYIGGDQIKYYRLPYQNTLSAEAAIPDNMVFKWVLTDDIDELYNDVEVYYRVELVDSLLNRVIVLKDLIPHSSFEGSVGEVSASLDQSFLSYNLNFDYFDQCDYLEDLTLSDISDVYLDLTGETRYTWKVSANNGQNCDELNLDPSSTFTGCEIIDIEQTCNAFHYCEWIETPIDNDGSACENILDGESCITQDIDGDTISDCMFIDNQCVEFDARCYKNTGNDFYIDLVSPVASISISQNELSPDLMEMYIAFDESLSDNLDSEVFIKNMSQNSNGKEYSLVEANNNNIYSILDPFPGTGTIQFDVTSWDEVGNGIITSRSISYEYVSSSSSSQIESPDHAMSIQFTDGDIQSDASLLIQKTNNEYSNYRSDIQKISNTYQISSVGMTIIDDVDIEFLIPEHYDDTEPWKLRIIQNGNNDITSLSREGAVYGKLNSLGDVALYYDSRMEFEVPSDVELLGNYPNPFNPSTRVYYIVDKNESEVKISVLDLLGREVKVLYDNVNDIGYYEIIWDGTGNDGHQLGSGVYFINAKVGNNQLYKKIMKLK